MNKKTISSSVPLKRKTEGPVGALRVVGAALTILSERGERGDTASAPPYRWQRAGLRVELRAWTNQLPTANGIGWRRSNDPVHKREGLAITEGGTRVFSAEWSPEIVLKVEHFASGPWVHTLFGVAAACLAGDGDGDGDGDGEAPEDEHSDRNDTDSDDGDAEFLGDDPAEVDNV